MLTRVQPGAEASGGREARPEVLGLEVDAKGMEEMCSWILQWASQGESRAVCVANAHLAVTAHDDPDLRALLNTSDLTTADGMPLAWMLRWAGYRGQERVTGPDLMGLLCDCSRQEGLKIGLYGGEPDVLRECIENLQARFPGLDVAYNYSPPFGRLSPEQEGEIVRDIRAAGVRLLFVGLSLPERERWLFRHRGQIPAVMIGVGAAFDFHAGRINRAPAWMQRLALEWLYRLAEEPQRLWRRYLSVNPRFAWYALRQLASQGTNKRRAARSSSESQINV